MFKKNLLALMVKSRGDFVIILRSHRLLILTYLLIFMFNL